MRISFFNTVLGAFLSTFILLISLYSTSKAQEIKSVHGIVLDEKQQPIPFVNIYLNDSTGTISNEQGFFSISVFDNQEGVLTFSSIGFKTITISIVGIMDDPVFKIIKMAISKSILKEFVVRPDSSQQLADRILTKAFQKKHKNYPTKKYSMNAFFREANINDTTYSRLLESYVLISDLGIKKSFEKTQFEVLELRKTLDHRELDMRQSLSNWLYLKNGLHRTLSNDRFRLKKWHGMFEYLENRKMEKLQKSLIDVSFFNETFLTENTFKLSNVQLLGKDSIAEISYQNRYETGFKIHNTNKIFVNLTDYAIIQYESVHHSEESSIIKGKPFNDSINFKLYVKYQKFNSRYYPKYINFKSIGTNSSFLISANFKDQYYSKGQTGNIYQFNELYITAIKPYQKIKKDKSLKLKQDIYDLKIKNNQAFWKNFNFPPSYQLTEKAKSELKRNRNVKNSIFLQ